MKQYENVLLVTGGAGFIGSAFLRMLVPKYPKWHFINLDALTYAGDLRKVEIIQDYENYVFVHGNICDRTLVQDLFDKYKINIVVNFAAESHVDNSIRDATSFIETNIKGAFTLLDVSREKWNLSRNKKINPHYRFVQISTDEVYGALDFYEPSWNENSSIQPNSPYSASKASAELLCRSFYKTYRLPILITRSSNNYGEYQNVEKFIPKIMTYCNENKLIPIYGEGVNIRDWIYVEDNISSIELVLKKGVVGEAYNIGGNNELSNIDLVNKILSLVPQSTSGFEFIEDRMGHDFRYSVSTLKLDSLGITFKSDFESSLLKTIESYRKQ